jgi:gliding motility-associated peptidyl-prolyl isomerase
MKINIIFIIGVLLFSCSESKSRKPVNHGGVSALEKTVAINKLLFANEEKKMQAYMVLDTIHTYINSKKGFWYTYISKNKKGAKPVTGNKVVFEQDIVALDGTILYAKNTLGLRNYVVDKEHVIKGVKEGIKIMREGEVVKFLFSSFVSYRMNGDSARVIDSNEPIISTIKLIKINN